MRGRQLRHLSLRLVLVRLLAEVDRLLALLLDRLGRRLLAVLARLILPRARLAPLGLLIDLHLRGEFGSDPLALRVRAQLARPLAELAGTVPLLLASRLARPLLLRLLHL